MKYFCQNLLILCSLLLICQFNGHTHVGVLVGVPVDAWVGWIDVVFLYGLAVGTDVGVLVGFIGSGKGGGGGRCQFNGHTHVGVLVGVLADAWVGWVGWVDVVFLYGFAVGTDVEVLVGHSRQGDCQTGMTRPCHSS